MTEEIHTCYMVDYDEITMLYCPGEILESNLILERLLEPHVACRFLRDPDRQIMSLEIYENATAYDALPIFEDEEIHETDLKFYEKHRDTLMLLPCLLSDESECDVIANPMMSVGAEWFDLPDITSGRFFLSYAFLDDKFQDVNLLNKIQYHEESSRKSKANIEIPLFGKTKHMWGFKNTEIEYYASTPPMIGDICFKLKPSIVKTLASDSELIDNFSSNKSVILYQNTLISDIPEPQDIYGRKSLDEKNIAKLKKILVEKLQKDVNLDYQNYYVYHGRSDDEIRSIESFELDYMHEIFSEPMSERILRNINKNLKRTALRDSEFKSPGLFRDSTVWFGRGNQVAADNPTKAFYVAPHHSYLSVYVEDWVKFANREDIPLSLHMALTYYYLIAIHPFRDGNGRTARFVAIWQFYRKTGILLPRLYADLQKVDDKTAYKKYMRGNVDDCLQIFRKILSESIGDVSLASEMLASGSAENLILIGTSEIVVAN